MKKHSTMTQSAVSLHLETLKNMALYEPLDEICHRFHVWIRTVMSPSRSKRVVQARTACCVHLRDSMEMSYTEIGKVMLRDHTSVLCMLRKERARVGRLEAASVRVEPETTPA